MPFVGDENITANNYNLGSVYKIKTIFDFRLY